MQTKMAIQQLFLIVAQASCTNQIWKDESRHKAGEQGT